MRAGQEWTVTLGTGTSLVHDGELWTVTGMDGGAVTLRGRAGRSLRVQTATMLTDPGTRIAGAREDLPAAVGPLLDDLTGAEQEKLAGRLGHVRELLTGYASGSDAIAAEGEPRPQYDPSLPAGDREAAKAAELGVSARTVRRWVADYLRAGAAGLVDGRSVRPSDALAGVDERWLAMCKIVLGEHTEASRPTRNLVLRRVSARLEAEHGPGTVKEPGVKKARAVLEELTRGTNTFTGSTKAKRSIAARPAGVYGRLRATRPGEYVLLDTTPLDVFAMEPVTLRWVRVELTIACARLNTDRCYDHSPCSHGDPRGRCTTRPGTLPIRKRCPPGFGVRRTAYGRSWMKREYRTGCRSCCRRGSSTTPG